MSKKYFFIFLFLCACAERKSPAEIIYNHVKKDDIKKEINLPVKNKQDYVVPSSISMDGKIIYHEVQIGETIEEIANIYDQEVEDVIRVNNLYPPYYLDEFDIIKIKVSKDYTKKDFKIEQDKLIPQNSRKFIMPMDGKIITTFGEKSKYGSKNKGINIAGEFGSKVFASAGGKVVYKGYDTIFGNLVIIKVEDIMTSYAHLEEVQVNKGQEVKQGDVIAYVGNSGKVKNPQLYFGIREGKTSKDPLMYIKN